MIKIICWDENIKHNNIKLKKKRSREVEFYVYIDYGFWLGLGSVIFVVYSAVIFVVYKLYASTIWKYLYIQTP